MPCEDLANVSTIDSTTLIVISVHIPKNSYLFKISPGQDLIFQILFPYYIIFTPLLQALSFECNVTM